MIRKVCVVTGTRAEYGLLRRTIALIDEEPSLLLQLIVTGTHLSPEHGLTINEIKADGIRIADTIDILLSSDTAVGVAKAVGLGIIGFAESLARLKPDLILLVGDRFEILAAATVALIHNIPIAHVHGGETTLGAIDESIRHSVTKFSQLHFVAVETYRDRVIQMGEQPDHVFVVGGLGIDAIANVSLLSKSELEESLDFDLGECFFIVTFHPPTSNQSGAEDQFGELLSALAMINQDIRLIFTMPNADTGGNAIRSKIIEFVSSRPNTKAYESLGQLRYLSSLKYAAAIVGNSSSGLAEAPSFKIGTINIGTRQAGRLKANSIIDCEPTQQSITDALDKLLSRAFQENLSQISNPNGDPGAAEAIVKIIKTHPLKNLTQKRFYDLPVQAPYSTSECFNIV